LLNKDFNRPTLSVRLRMTIEGQGIRIKTREDVSFTPVSLLAGQPYYVLPIDLSQYFTVNNIELSGLTQQEYIQTGKLPEGFYTFCFEAVETTTGQTVSNKGCAFAWINLNEPPLLNLPAKGESVIPSETSATQNIVFNWTPRHTASPGAAYTTQYIFTLVELTDSSIAPEAGFVNGTPLHVDTTSSSSYQYNNTKPALIIGKRYAWRIQAKTKNSTTGIEIANFKNNGFSEVFWFMYKNNCPPLIGISDSVSGYRAIINWLGNTQYLGYKILYREKNTAGAEWFPVFTTDLQIGISDLKPQTTYEYRVGTTCENGTSYVFAATREFTTKDSSYTSINVPNCGVDPNLVSPPNSSPLVTLAAGDTIRAGDFKVVVTNNPAPTGSNGTFSGAGYVIIPYLGNVKLAVVFNNVGVSDTNNIKRLVNGKIETTYDPSEGGILSLDDIIDAFTYLLQIINLQNNASPTQVNSLINSAQANLTGLPSNVNQQVISLLQSYYAASLVINNAQNQIDTSNGTNNTSLLNNINNSNQKLDSIKSALMSIVNEYRNMNGTKITYPYYYTAIAYFEVGELVNGISNKIINIYTKKKLPPELALGAKKIIAERSNSVYNFLDSTTTKINLFYEPFDPQKIDSLPQKVSSNFTFFLLYQLRKDTLPYTVAFIHRHANVNLFDMSDSLIIGNSGKPLLMEMDPDKEKSQFNTLTLGQNELKFIQKYENGGAEKTDTIKIPVIKEITIKNLCVKIVTKPNKKYFDGSTVGNVSNNDPKLAKQEELNMSLYNSLATGDTLMPKPLWLINNYQKGGSNIIIRVDTVETINIYPDSITYQINPNNGAIIITLNKEPMDPNNTGRFIWDVSWLRGRDTTVAKTLFTYCENKLKIKDINMYNIMKNNFNPIIRPLYANDQVDTTFRKIGLEGLTYSFTFPSLARLDLLKSSIKKIVVNGDSIINNDFILISKLKLTEINLIESATPSGDTTGIIGIILNKLRRIPATRKMADTLKNNILAHTNNSAFNARIFFMVTALEVPDYLTFDLATGSIHRLNFTILGSNQIDFGKVFYHELLHVYYPYTHQLDKLRWMVVREKQAVYGYKLGNELGKNGYCSAGEGHEWYNPENAAVCNGEVSF
jgi:hypothetical protein